jgi:hypothetical protein
MPTRLGPRFALEASFLILLSVLAVLADLSWQLILVVMGTAWLLLAILEFARWKEGLRPPARARRAALPVDEATRVLRPDELAAQPEGRGT